MAGDDPQDETRGLEIEDKMKASRSWAAWPEDMKQLIVNGLIEELDAPRVSKSAVAKMNAAEWRQYVANDHQPFSRECVACLEGAGWTRPHRRVPAPDALTLSIDICGPFREGEDQQRVKVKYFMVGVYTIPVRKEGKNLNALAPSLKDVLAGKHLGVEDDPDACPEDWQPLADEHRDAAKQGDPKLLEEWERLEVEAEDVEVRNYTMVECLKSRHHTEVVSGMARMVARLRYLGLDVRRIHSDADQEMLSTRRWCSDRSIYRTFTCGSDWKSNGKAEAEIGVIRRRVNVLMKPASGDAESYWPLMARHVAERRGRLQLKALGFVTPKLLAWCTKVMVTTKGWDNFQGHWRRRKKPGEVRGPDMNMSLTSGGHYVEVEDGHHVRTDDLLLAGSHEELEEVEPVRALAREGGGSHGWHGGAAQ